MKKEAKMKCRIKDSKMREAAVTLFGDLAEEFDYGPGITAVEVSFAPLHSINNELSCIFHPLTNELEIEPVHEIVDGWHSFPADKPEKVRKYLVAYDCDGDRDVDVMVWNGEYFYPAEDDVVAWREFPKFW